MAGAFTLNNVATADDYTSEATITGAPWSTRIILQITNNAVFYQLLNKGGAWGDEVFCTPVVGARALACSGIRFRSALGGQPARVSCEIVTDDILGTGADSLVSAGYTVDSTGGVTPNPPPSPVNVNLQHNATPIATQDTIDFEDSSTVAFGVTNDPGNARVQVTADSALPVQHNGATVATEERLDFVDTGAITVSVANDPVNARVQVSAALLGFGGAPAGASYLGTYDFFGSPSVDVPNLNAAPATSFRHLLLLVNCRSQEPAVATDTLDLRVNHDSGSHYNWLATEALEGAASPSISSFRNDGRILVGDVPAALELSGVFAEYAITVYDFHNLSVAQIQTHSRGGLLYAGGSPGMATYDVFGNWNQFTALSSLTLFSHTGSGLVGQVHAYGLV